VSRLLIGGALAGCAQSRGPATSAYLRECDAASAALAGQVRELPKIPPPSRPSLPASPTAEELRIFNGMERIYPLFVNQYYGAVFDRCQALAQLYSQTQDRVAAVKADGVDSAAVQFVALRLQASGQRREVFVELGRLAALNRDALKRRRTTDSLDEILQGVAGGVVETLAVCGDDGAAAAGVLSKLREAADAASRRETDREAVAGQIAREAAAVAELQRGEADCLAARVKLLSDLRARYPGQDWDGAPGK
jgi:hypothetical protein